MRQAKCRVIALCVPEDVREHTGPGSLQLSPRNIAAAAKIVNERVKDEKIVIKAGVVEGQGVDAGCSNC